MEKVETCHEYRCRPVGEQDFFLLADLHARCFPGYFLTKLGKPLLARYYRAYWQEDPSLFFVLEHVASKEPAGFVMGYFKGSNARSQFQKQCLLPLCGALLRLCLKGDQDCWRRVFSFVRSIGGRQEKPEEEKWDASLLSIAVLEQHRGTGAAGHLVYAFEQALLQSVNPARYCLSVRPNNKAAIRFYEKLGMRVVGVSDDVTYIKQISRA